MVTATVTRTPTNFDVLPQIKQGISSRQTQTIPTPAPTQSRPIDYHAEPKNIPDIQQKIKNKEPIISGAKSQFSVYQDPTLPQGVTQADVEGTAAVGKFLLGFGDQISGQNTIQKNDYQIRNNQRNIFTPLENFGYDIGRRTADGAQNALDDLWKHRPQFEIPTIKIPKFERPGLPDIFKPKPNPETEKKPTNKPIPGEPKPTVEEPKPQPEPQQKEKDIPRETPPKIKPVPKDLTRQLRELELSPCGITSFWIVWSYKITGYGDNGNIFTQSTIEEVYRVASKIPDVTRYYPNIRDFADSGGGFGGGGSINLGSNVSYEFVNKGFGVYNEDGSDSGITYPRYVYNSRAVTIRGLKNKSAIASILADLSASNSGYEPQVYYIDIGTPNNEDCPIGKPAPLPEPPPKPPQDCECMSKCCPEIDYRKIQKMIEEELKKVDVTAAIPLSFQIRHEGDTPQMVIQCAERKSAASGNTPAKYDSAKYPITVPHWKGDQSDKPSIPPYKKGNWEGILVLADNSKVTINAQNEAECTKILNAIKPWIDKKMLEGSYFKGGMITTKEPIKETQVYPKYGRYFSKGQKNNKPDWRVDFP